MFYTITWLKIIFRILLKKEGLLSINQFTQIRINMKTAIYQYWYGSKPKESANAGRKNMEAYANKIGADYIFETDPKFYGGPCSLEKKYSALRPIYDDMFLKYDKVGHLFKKKL